MLRQTKWQLEASDAVSWHQDEALNSTIFLLREMGPTSFLLKEEEEDRKLKVNIGDPHSCTCDVFKRERNPCKHICWLILKKFKWPRTNELSYQHGLVEREINQLLQGPKKVKKEQPKGNKDIGTSEKGTAQQRAISKLDVCPICQEELLDNHLPVTYCRYGCGNSVHIKCMKIWAEHQRQSSKDDEIRCPMCREIFGSFYKLLEELRNASGDDIEAYRLDVHFSISCNGCQMCPIKGKCYKCTTCSSFYLCNTCFHGNKHRHHSFEFRLKRTNRWRPAKSRLQTDRELAIINDLSTREITDNDYDLLLQLDSSSGDTAPVDLCGLPEHVINTLPMMKVRPGAKLLVPGKQCRICLRSYEVGEYVRKLPECKHIFHRECIDDWLSEDHRRCPIDKRLVVGMHRRQQSATSTSRQRSRQQDIEATDMSTELMIPGIGIAKLQNMQNQNDRRYNADARNASNIDNRTLSTATNYQSSSSVNPVGITIEDVVSGCHTLSLSRKAELNHRSRHLSLPPQNPLHVRQRAKSRSNHAFTPNGIAKGSVVRSRNRSFERKTAPHSSQVDLWLTGNSPLSGTDLQSIQPMTFDDDLP
ncbi:E3 ubiquitin-protein ligase Zswim2-like isoform X1 [Styela clava]